ncbi:MAG: thioredoxin family protein, partial [Thermoanaerobaculia bacterium]
MRAALLLAVTPCLSLAEETSLRWETSLPEALKRARSEKRLVMVDFWRDNCVFCVRLEEQTFTDRKVQEALREFVPVRARN